MKFTRRFGCRKKQSVRISVILELLLNHKELEGAFYMKRLRLDNIFPMAYRLDHSDERFVKKYEKTAATIHHPPHDFQN